MQIHNFKLIIMAVLVYTNLFQQNISADPRNVIDYVLESQIAGEICTYELNEWQLGIILVKNGIKGEDMEQGGLRYDDFKIAENRITNNMKEFAAKYEDKKEALKLVCDDFWGLYGPQGKLARDLLKTPDS